VAEGVTTTDRESLREAVEDCESLREAVEDCESLREAVEACESLREAVTDLDSLRDSLLVAVTDCVNEGLTVPDGVGDATSHVKQPNV